MTAFRRRNVTVVLAAPLAFGLWSLLRGQDTSWDLRNYHWYNPFALLNGRADWDAAPAGLQTYFSPLVDLAWYALARSLPAPWVGFIIGAVQSANFVLLYRLGLRLLPVERPLERQLVALLAAITGVCGAATVTEIGTTFNDAVVSVGALGSLVLVARWWPSLIHGTRHEAVLRAMLAGLPVGAAFACKLTMGTFAVGLAAGFIVAPCPLPRRIRLAGSFAVGVATATAILLGPWLWQVWRQTGNPIFPYLNGLFGSPLVSPDYNWLISMQPDSLAETLLLPLRFIGIGRPVSEFPFRDYRIIAAYVLVPPLLAVVACRTARRPAAAPTAAGYVFAAMLTAYACWVVAFSYYRYLIALEILAPLLIALAILRVPVMPWLQRLAVGLVMVLLLASGQGADYGHVPWSDRFVDVDVPVLARPDATVVLLVGHPMAFVVPSFPPSVRFLQLAPNFGSSEDPASSWHRLMQDRIDAHRGDFYAILVGKTVLPPRDGLAAYGLALVEAECRPLETNLSRFPDDNLHFCPVVRRPAS